MPYPHINRMPRANCLGDLYSGDRPHSDFSELVWENGQILIQGQSNKTPKTSNNGKEEEHILVPAKNIPHSDFSTSGPSSRPMGSGQEDELVHWLNYPLDDYSSEFFSEFHHHAFAVQNSAVPVVKGGSGKSEQGSNASKLVKESHGSKEVQQPEPRGLTNFSHFIRPSPLPKTNSENVVDRGRNKGDRSGASCSNHVKSTVIDSTTSLTGHQSKLHALAPPPPKVDVKPSSKGGKEPVSIEQSKPNCPEDVGPSSSFAASTGIEPVVASSSVCSGNITRGASNDLKHRFKRKYRDTEESDCPSEDAEEESVGIRKPVNARGTSTKRTRAAEVHNLSERKRRDRINEKMRALQELIPNCNKVDKASMLDEAIEYLKTLQIQVQMMSMGSGMFMPPMMLPPNAMQHVNAPHLQHFSQINAGMGMGFGMGMVDMLQVPPMHGGQFHYSPIAGHSSVPIMFGHPGQGMHMSMPPAPFIPHPGAPSMHPTSLPLVSGITTPKEIPDLTMPSSSNAPLQNINAQLPNAECSQNQTPVQCQETKESFKQSAIVEHIYDQPLQPNENRAIDSS